MRGQVIVVVGRSTDGTFERAAGSGATVLHDGGRGKGEALRRAIPLHPDAGHGVSRRRRLARPGRHSRCWWSRSWRTKPITSRPRGCEADRASCMAGSTSSCGSPAVRSSPRASTGASDCRLSDSQNGFRAVRTSVLQQLDLRENGDDHRTGNDHQDAAPRVADGGSSQPRAPARAWPLAYPRRGAARRATAIHSSSTCSSDAANPRRPDDTVNILGIWDGHDSGAALLQDGQLSVLPSTRSG